MLHDYLFATISSIIKIKGNILKINVFLNTKINLLNKKINLLNRKIN